jgi:ethanolamine utilization protein EutM
MAKTNESQIDIQKSETEEMDPGMRALGMIETRGLVACIEAADAMIKASDITLLDLRAIGAGYMTVMARGDVGAVRTAIEAGTLAARRLGEVVSVRILPSPHLDIEDLLPNSL